MNCSSRPLDPALPNVQEAVIVHRAVFVCSVPHSATYNNALNPYLHTLINRVLVLSFDNKSAFNLVVS